MRAAAAQHDPLDGAAAGVARLPRAPEDGHSVLHIAHLAVGLHVGADAGPLALDAHRQHLADGGVERGDLVRG